GFYSIMGALSGHPAVKAVCPQAPVVDWFKGDDFHHNGALILCDAFRFHSSVGRPRPVPTMSQSRNATYYRTDEYSFFLKTGAIKNFTALLGDSIQFWKDMMQHSDYDAWWQARDARTGCYKIKPAMLVVGGLFDAEDCYGAWELYKAVHKQSPNTTLQLVMGPWHHGGWRSKDGSYLGNIRFGEKTSVYYQKELEFPFLNSYLKEEVAERNKAKATIFFSGENSWRKFDSWPPKEVKMTSLFLHEKGLLSFEAPHAVSSYSEYVSDPSNPVPYTDKTQRTRAKEYMTDDQRFANRRQDVIAFETPLLTEDITIGGELVANLKVALSTTDADFVVKLIDVFPDDFSYNTKEMGKGNGQNYLMNGYQMLVRGEVMRGKYRRSFEIPEPFVPGKPTTVSFHLPDVAHTFKKGHRIMVQIQSSWFPLVDRNPQQFTNIYHCDDSAFVKSTIRVFHQQDNASALILPQIK
ncbi:MAG: CocE/NonD family hydrolase, partial [Bacteroides sp.]